MNVLLAVDGSDYTQRMLAYLASHEALLGKGNRFTALTVTTAIPRRVAHFVDKAAVESFGNEQAEAVLKPVEAFAQQQQWDLRTAHVPGPAAEAIARYAQESQADLIVMGTHGHSALGSLITGSTVSGVLARCQTPVLLVR
jgi:nucleotide-binding universal stress UspA family protein